MENDEIIQPDLFGLREKQEQSKQALIERNLADKAAGIKPVKKPLFDAIEPEKEGDGQ